MNFNQPNSQSEEEKSQEAINSILGEFKHVPPVQPSQIDVSSLFNFAGMETNRTGESSMEDTFVS